MKRFAIVAGGLLAACACSGPVRDEARWTVLGQPASAEVIAASGPDASALLATLRASMADAEALFDPTRSDSEISRLNLIAPRDYYRLGEHPDLYRSIRLALDYARVASGTYDPTAAEPPAPIDWGGVITDREALAVRFRDPAMRLDLSQIAPGYTLDIAARNFVRMSSRAALLRLGDHAYAWQHPPGASAWSVELDDPRVPGRALLTIELAGRGVAVAARAPHRGAPPLDPATGRPAASEIVVAVAIADAAADADVLSSALLVGGVRRTGALLAETRRVEAVLLVESDGRSYLLASASLRGRIVPSVDLEREVSGELRWRLPPAAL